MWNTCATCLLCAFACVFSLFQFLFSSHSDKRKRIDRQGGKYDWMFMWQTKRGHKQQRCWVVDTTQFPIRLLQVLQLQTILIAQSIFYIRNLYIECVPFLNEWSKKNHQNSSNNNNNDESYDPFLCLSYLLKMIVLVNKLKNAKPEGKKHKQRDRQTRTTYKIMKQKKFGCAWTEKKNRGNKNTRTNTREYQKGSFCCCCCIFLNRLQFLSMVNLDMNKNTCKINKIDCKIRKPKCRRKSNQMFSFIIITFFRIQYNFNNYIKYWLFWMGDSQTRLRDNSV